MKVGDRVIVNGLYDNLEIKNQKGSISGFSAYTDNVLIDFDERFIDELHDGNGTNKEKVNIKNGWYCKREHIIIIEKSSPIKDKNKGENMRVKKLLNKIEGNLEISSMLSIYQYGITLKCLEDILQDSNSELAQRCNDIQHKIIFKEEKW